MALPLQSEGARSRRCAEIQAPRAFATALPARSDATASHRGIAAGMGAGRGSAPGPLHALAPAALVAALVLLERPHQPGAVRMGHAQVDAPPALSLQPREVAIRRPRSVLSETERAMPPPAMAAAEGPRLLPGPRIEVRPVQAGGGLAGGGGLGNLPDRDGHACIVDHRPKGAGARAAAVENHPFLVPSAPWGGRLPAVRALSLSAIDRHGRAPATELLGIKSLAPSPPAWAPSEGSGAG